MPQSSGGSLADLFSGLQCPPPLPPKQCPKWRPWIITFENVPAGSHGELTVAQGYIETADGGAEPCPLISMKNINLAGESAIVTEPRIPYECKPLPEPSFALCLSLGMMLLVVLARGKTTTAR